jgi:hypothetical protein
VNGHVYKAGNWLAEMPIARDAQLTLTNVLGGTASVYRTGFMIDVPFPVSQDGRFATINAPMPVRILGLTLEVDKANHVARWNAPQPAGVPSYYDSLAEVVVLVYGYADETQVLLNKHSWEPYSVHGGISLHVIATSEVLEGKQHEDDTDGALRTVFGPSYPGLTYTVTPPRPQASPWRDPVSQNFGDKQGLQERGGRLYESNGDLAFALAELEHPAPRAQRLERLGRMHRQGRRIESVWRRPDPLTGSCVCGPVSGN